MSQTQIVIIYSPNHGRRRTVILPDDDSQVPVHTTNLAPGEQVMVGSLSDYLTIGPDAMLQRYLGKPPVNDRCALVNAAGVVVAHLCADPLIDRVDGHTLHHDPQGKSVVGKLVNLFLAG